MKGFSPRTKVSVIYCAVKYQYYDLKALPCAGECVY